MEIGTQLIGRVGSEGREGRWDGARSPDRRDVKEGRWWSRPSDAQRNFVQNKTNNKNSQINYGNRVHQTMHEIHIGRTILAYYPPYLSRQRPG